MMAKILVTGGAGFIGSSLVKQLLSKGYFVVVVDNLLTGTRDNLPIEDEQFKFIKCDVNDSFSIGSIMTSYQFDYVFHYAALVGVLRTLENPVDVLKDIEGIRNILELSKNTGVKRVFYSSSSEVYGEPVELPQNEQTTPLNSRLPYAIVKNVGEAYCRSFQKEFLLDYTIFRFFNTYGPTQSKDFVISKFLSQALNSQDITIYGDGHQTRTFCHIHDNVQATINALEKNLFVNDVVNIGNDAIITVKELANKIISVSNSSSKIKFLPPLEEGDMSRRMPDITKMKKLLNNELMSLDQGLASLL